MEVGAVVVPQTEESAVATAPEVVISDEQKEFANNMAFSMGDTIPYPADKPAEAVVEQAAVVANVSHETPLVDYTAFLKENFGVESIDEAKSQWQSLQELKTKQASPEAQAFTPEAIREAAQILEKQDRWARLTEGEITKENAADIVKEHMKHRYSGLTTDQVNYKFNKQFGIPKAPVQLVTEDDDEFLIRKNEWNEQVANAEMELIIEANLAKPDLIKAKEELKLPNIQLQQSVVDEDYEAYKASSAAVSEKVNNILIPAIKALKESDVNLGIKVQDANNQLDFEVALTPTSEDFEKARQDSLSFDSFINKVCYDANGNFLPQNVQKLILLYENYDKYAQSIARQAVNAERKRVVTKEAPHLADTKDFNVNGEKSEFQKQMEFALS